MKTRNYVNAICETLKALHKRYPTQNIGRHLDQSLADYNLFGLSDKELAYALDKYMQTLEIDPIASESEIDLIIEDGKNLDKYIGGADPYNLDDEEEDY